jgi:hypothetical protein
MREVQTSLVPLSPANAVVAGDGREHPAGLARVQGATGPSAEGGGGCDSEVGWGGLFHLQGLTQLKVLVLSNAQATDSWLVPLRGLTNLQELYLNRNTKFTDEGCDELQKTLPNLIIVR